MFTYPHRLSSRLKLFLHLVSGRDWYELIACHWLAAQYRGLGEIHLIVDGTKIGSGHQLLMVAMTYRKRAIPIVWTWVKQVRGHSGAGRQLALLSMSESCCPKELVYSW